MWVSPDGIGHHFILTAALEAKDKNQEAVEWLMAHYPATCAWLDLARKNPRGVHRTTMFDRILQDFVSRAGFVRQ